MQQLAAQLTLGLSLKDEATFANFYSGKNAETIIELKKVAEGLGEKIIYLCNAGGFGGSHLLQAVCHEAHLHQLSSVYLPLNNLLTFPTEILNGLENLSIVCMDHLEVIAGKTEWEEAVFHLYNRIFDVGGYLILSANDLPHSIPFQLADLTSRLSYGVTYQLHALSDDEKLSALIMRAKARGMHLTDDVAHYLLTHCKRQMSALFEALNILDKASLAEKRRLTIPFVKKVLHI